MTGAELVAAPWSRRDAAATSKTIGGGAMYRVARWSILAALCVFGSQPAHAQDAASKPKIVPPGEAAGAIGRDDDWTKWIELPEVAPYFDLRVRPLDADSGKHVGGDAPRNPRAGSPTGEAISRPTAFRSASKPRKICRTRSGSGAIVQRTTSARPVSQSLGDQADRVTPRRRMG